MRVLVADDHSLFRDGLCSLLEAAQFTVVGQVGDGLAAVEATLQQRPDIVLLDGDMPGLPGIEALRKIRAQWPGVRAIIMTNAEDDGEILEAVNAGACGYLSKGLRASEFIELLRGVEHGDAAMTHHATARLLANLSQVADRHHHSPNGLTERELELLHLMAEGHSNKDIAHRLTVSENTVKYHIKNILQKLDVHNRTEAAAHAIRIGLVKPNASNR